MSKRLSERQYRNAWLVGIALLVTIIGLALATRAYTFVPSSAVSRWQDVSWWVISLAFLVIAVLRVLQLRKSGFPVPNFAAIFVGSVIFGWMLSRTVEGALMSINVLVEAEAEQVICLLVISNDLVPESGFRTRTHEIRVRVANEQDIREIEYRRPQVDLARFQANDFVALRVHKGPFGFRATGIASATCER